MRDRFDVTLAISGTTLVVGAYCGPNNFGVAYIFPPLGIELEQTGRDQGRYFRLLAGDESTTMEGKLAMLRPGARRRSPP